MTSKNTICIWYEGGAVDAANFYAKTFPDSAVGTIHRAPGDYPDGKQGDVLTVEFTVVGIPCIGLNGGPHFKHNEAFVGDVQRLQARDAYTAAKAVDNALIEEMRK